MRFLTDLITKGAISAAKAGGFVAVGAVIGGILLYWFNTSQGYLCTDPANEACQRGALIFLLIGGLFGAAIGAGVAEEYASYKKRQSERRAGSHPPT